MNKIFIDGEAGTTGLRIAERLELRKDISLLKIDPDMRKDKEARKALLNEADVVFLCLPDDASREAVSLIENPKVRVIDASTAHRTNPDWAYGLPELSGTHRESIINAKRVANPGCHATGFNVLVYPLVKSGLIAPDYPFSCHSLTGYSGGGKKMIAEYEDKNRSEIYASPRQYAFTQSHKHLPEMQTVCGLSYPPLFSPIVADYYAGMEVTVPVHMQLLKRPMKAQELWEFYNDYYKGSLVISVSPYNGGSPAGGFMDAGALAGSDALEIHVCGNDDRAVIISRFDNLGKGASGAAVQCMNLMLGLGETEGLSL